MTISVPETIAVWCIMLQSFHHGCRMSPTRLVSPVVCNSADTRYVASSSALRRQSHMTIPDREASEISEDDSESYASVLDVFTGTPAQVRHAVHHQSCGAWPAWQRVIVVSSVRRTTSWNTSALVCTPLLRVLNGGRHCARLHYGGPMM